MKLSIVINVDTRSGFDSSESAFNGMNEGCRSLDFLISGVLNKIDFFSGTEKEVIVFVDEHVTLPSEVLLKMHAICDTLVVRRHCKHFGDDTHYNRYNDLNYLAALAMARGEYIAHFDADTVAFARHPAVTFERMVEHLNKYAYVSYPSPWSPAPVVDKSFDYWWASTRFFMCKRETFQYSETLKCLQDNDYLYSKYGDHQRRCPWTEHILSLIAGPNQVYYPPMDMDNYMVFCWDKYIKGTLSRLNMMTYSDVLKYVKSCGGIHYPNDVTAKPL